MNRGIYAIRDVKISEYLNIIHLKNAAEAERFFLMVCADPRAPMSKAPKDYTIYEVGHFDTETGVVTPCLPRDVTPHSAVDMAIRENQNAQEKSRGT